MTRKTLIAAARASNEHTVEDSHELALIATKERFQGWGSRRVEVETRKGGGLWCKDTLKLTTVSKAAEWLGLGGTA